MCPFNHFSCNQEDFRWKKVTYTIYQSIYHQNYMVPSWLQLEIPTLKMLLLTSGATKMLCKSVDPVYHTFSKLWPFYPVFASISNNKSIILVYDTPSCWNGDYFLWYQFCKQENDKRVHRMYHSVYHLPISWICA